MTNHASSLSSTLPDDASNQSQSLIYSHGNASTIELQGGNNDICNSSTPPCISHEDPECPAAPAGEGRQAVLEQCSSQPQVPEESLSNMLCSLQSTVICEAEGSACQTFAERDNDALRGYFAVRTNIVLTSTCPEVAPHIVITPVEESVEDFYVPYRNRVDYHLQNPYLLTVPWRDPIRLARKPYLDEHCYWPVPRPHDSISMDTGIPRRVFCRSHFNHLTQLTANERLNMNHVVAAVQRHRLKVAAIEACERATTLRKRYDDEAFLQTFEKPFQWTDPAEPLLKCAGYPGIVIFDSPNPFTAPHIMLCTPPQQDPWIPYSTATSDPQDGGFGRYLVVPSPHVSFINMGDFPSYDDFDSSDDDHDDETCDSPSEPTSPEPTTPLELDDDPFLSWNCPDAENDTDEDDLTSESRPISSGFASSWDDSSRIDGIQALPPRPGKPIFYVDEDEEDDLPPLDDWYLSVAQRNGVHIAA